MEKSSHTKRLSVFVIFKNLKETAKETKVKIDEVSHSKD